MPNINVGDMARIVKCEDPRNIGKQVFVIGRKPACPECGQFMWKVEILEPAWGHSTIFNIFEVEQRLEAGSVLECHDDSLRRIDPPLDEEPAPPAQLIKPREYT